MEGGAGMRRKPVVFSLLLAALLLTTLLVFRLMQQSTSQLQSSPVHLMLDVIPGADVGSGSRESWLRSRAEEFESQNPDVYITVRALKSDQAQMIYTQSEQLQQRANLVAYSSGGFSQAELLVPIDDGITDAIIPSLRSGSDTRAAAYMYAGYVLLAKANALDSQNTLQNSASLIANLLPFDHGGICAALVTTPHAQNLISDTRVQAISDFDGTDDGVLVASHYMAYRYKRMESAGEYDSLTIAPLAYGFTDQVHYISVIAHDSEKDAAAQRFVAFLLSEDSQKKTADIGMFAACDVSVTYEEGTILQALWQASSPQMMCPDPFAWCTARDTAQSLARSVFAGDASARSSLEKLLKSLAGMDRTDAMR
jgi:hypothetical protein